MRKLLLILLAGCPFSVFASHIVGGEFELVHLNGTQYRLNLIIYFDKINGSGGAKDNSARVYIYRKRDRVQVGTALLNLFAESNVPYTQPECSHGEIITTKLEYTSTLELPPSIYDDPDGYFVSWERCCRNYSITNIYSEEPNFSTSRYAGQTFYLEFPAVVKNGVPFINSSPRLFPPLNDYASPFRPYYVDFAGIDDDGDSLVYSLVTPLNTTSLVALPTPSGGPYPEVQWKPGYSLNNIINGLPDLRISKDGLLTATPRTQGLFVFGVKVEEFRNKQKIGESRRDFQMLVVDAAAPAVPPKIKGKKLTDASFTYVDNMSVSYSNTTADGDRCIQVSISDEDSKTPSGEWVSIRVVGLNFKDKKLNQILPAVTQKFLFNGTTAEFSICFPQCPYFEGGPYQVGIIAMDDACSLPLTDTLRVTVNVQPPPNAKPYFTSASPVIAQIKEGDQQSWTFEAKDDDLDELVVSVLTEGFTLADAGMTFSIDEQQNGYVKGKLKWDAFCNIYDFTKRNYFEVTIQVEDKDKCELKNPVKAQYKLSVILPGNADPIIDSDLTVKPLERIVDLNKKVFDTVRFKVTGFDRIDNDFLSLSGKGKDFNLTDYGITFQPGTGTGTVSSDFTWAIGCTTVDLKKKDLFQFQFIVVDNSNKCRFYKADTLDVNIKVLPPDNFKPVLSIQKDNETLSTQSLEYTLGDEIKFTVIGTDADTKPKKDHIKLSLIGAIGNVSPIIGYEFANTEGSGRISSLFRWQPDCSIFADGVYTNDYTFKFRLADDRCLVPKADTTTVHLRIKDKEGPEGEFIPTNFISPNGDNCNDYFAMEFQDPEMCGYRSNRFHFPEDNCVSRFESVKIVNRWGKEVFQSTDRNFRWYALNESAGVYYYVIKFTNKSYKGPLNVRF